MVEPYRAVTVELVNPINPSVRPFPSGLREQCVAVFIVHTDERSALYRAADHGWPPCRFVIGTTTDPQFVELYLDHHSRPAPRSSLDELPIRATLATRQHRPDAPRCMFGSRLVIAARPWRTSYSRSRRPLDGLAGRSSWRSTATRGSVAPRGTTSGLGRQGQRGAAHAAILLPSQRTPLANITGTITRTSSPFDSLSRS